MNTHRFTLPIHVRALVTARNEPRDHHKDADLRFTFDGNLVGDLGEAVAADMFALQLTGRSNEGVDGYARDGRSVQIKASGTSREPAFRVVDIRADHLSLFHFDYDDCSGEVIYNGSEEPVLRLLPIDWSGQRCVSLPALKRLNAQIPDAERLEMREAE